MIRYCTRCLYPDNHPLGISIDADGVCSGCRVHEEKDQLDWRSRELALERLLSGYRGRSRGRHDCIIPITGGRDSFFIVHTIRKVFGLNPLLVVYNRHYNSRAGIHNIARLRTVFGCDIYTLTLAPGVVQQMMRATLEECGSFHWHALAGHTVFPVQMAVRMNIPLVIWGAHQGLEQVGMFSHLDEVEMSRRYRREHDLMGLEAEDLVGRRGLNEATLQPLFYPEDRELRRSGVRGVYLGNYIRWDTKAQHERMVALYDYYMGPLSRTFDTYNDVDDVHFAGAHDVVKLRKCGYGKATDDACREIRFGRLTREQGLKLVQRYKTRPTPDMRLLEDFVGLTEQQIMSLVDGSCTDLPRGQSITADMVSDEEAFNQPKTCLFTTRNPEDFCGDPQSQQLLTRGYSREHDVAN